MLMYVVVGTSATGDILKPVDLIHPYIYIHTSIQINEKNVFTA